MAKESAVLPLAACSTSAAGGAPPWMCQDGIAEPVLGRLAWHGGEEGEVLVDRARDDVEMQLLRLARALIHEQREALGAGVAQPLVDGQAVAFGLRDLLAALVEEQLVVEPFRRRAAERARTMVPDSLTLSMRSLPAIS